MDLQQFILDQAMYDSANREDIGMYQQLEDQGANSYNVILKAIDNGNIKVVDFLLSQGASPDGSSIGTHGSSIGTHGSSISTHNSEVTPLMEAIYAHRDQIARLLIDYHANLNPITGPTPLQIAAQSGSLDIFKYLVEKGANLYHWVDNTYDLLAIASINDNLDVVKYLVEEKNFDPFLPNRKGKTAYDLSEENPQANKVFNYLQLKLKGLPDETDGETQITNLMIAINDRDISLIENYLLTALKINDSDKLGNTPLHYAVKSEDRSIVRKLLKAGADPNLKNNKGGSPLTYLLVSAEQKPPDRQLIRLLIEGGTQLSELDLKIGNPDSIDYINSLPTIDIIKSCVNKEDPITQYDLNSKGTIMISWPGVGKSMCYDLLNLQDYVSSPNAQKGGRYEIPPRRYINKESQVQILKGLHHRYRAEKIGTFKPEDGLYPIYQLYPY